MASCCHDFSYLEKSPNLVLLDCPTKTGLGPLISCTMLREFVVAASCLVLLSSVISSVTYIALQNDYLQSRQPLVYVPPVLHLVISLAGLVINFFAVFVMFQKISAVVSVFVYFALSVTAGSILAVHDPISYSGATYPTYVYYYYYIIVMLFLSPISVGSNFITFMLEGQ